MTILTNDKKNLNIRVTDLVENPTPRVPICLCLDTSFSMGATEGGTYTGQTIFRDGQNWNIVTGGVSRIEEMSKGVKGFYEALRKDPTAFYSAEVSIVTFDDAARCIEDFANLERQENDHEFVHNGQTAMGEGVNMALDLLEGRKQEYLDNGVDYYQPWLVLMTDGANTGSEAALNRAVDRVKDLVEAKKLSVFAIGVGKDADMDALNRLSPKRSALRLQGLKFEEFFEWLGKSVSRVSQSTPGTSVELDVNGIKGWATL